MLAEHYPEQEPLSEGARKYALHLSELGSPPAIDRQIGQDPYQSIALYPPKNPDGPVLAFLHGGGWTNGYKEWMAFMAPAFTEAGVLFASIGYRLAPMYLFPAGFDDIANAIAWLARHAAEYGGDPKRLYLGGHSAGGHYAALLGVRRGWQAARGLPVDVLRGCLPISGTYYFTAGSGLSVRPRFLGPEASGADAAASPIHNLQQPFPPFLIAHGTEDFPHLVRQAEEFEQALGAAGGKVERLAFAGRNHFSASYAGGERDGPWVPRALDFIRQN